MYGVIYKITNKISGKSYIGQTIRDFDIRWKEHCGDKRHSAYIYNAVKKYGESIFSREIIGIYNNLIDLNNAEAYFVDYHNCIAPNGYNLHSGGNSHKVSEETRKRMSESKKGNKSYWFGKLHSTESKSKISVANTGRKMSEETKNKMSASKKGEKHHNFGKWSCNEIEIIFNTCNQKKKIPIFCLELNEYFDSISAAARKLKIGKSNISSVIKGKYRQTNGYTFTYVQEKK